MMLRKLSLLCSALLMLSTLPACYESPGVVYFEAGQYKGTADPLCEKEKSPEHQQTLRARLEQVQTDR